MRRLGPVGAAITAALALAAVLYLLIAGPEPRAGGASLNPSGRPGRTAPPPGAAFAARTVADRQALDRPVAGGARAGEVEAAAARKAGPASETPDDAPMGAEGGGVPGPGAPRELSNAEILARIEAGEPGFEVLASRLDLGTEKVEPCFKVGEDWIVETFRRQMQAPADSWTGPGLWRFRIEREVSFRDLPCYEFVVTRADDPAYPPAVFYVTRGAYRLAGMQTTLQQQGKTRTVTYIPDEPAAGGAEESEALKAPFTIVPFDLPPVGAKARVVPAGMPLDRLLRIGPGQLARMPPAQALVGAQGRYLDLEYENPLDHTLVRQRWSPEDMRWPVVSQTETTLSFRRKN